MNTVIIDDKSSVRNTLKMMLEVYAPQVNLLGEADGIQTGLQLIKEKQPELVLLDVEMEDGTGFDLLSLCPQIDFKTIFITAHDIYAIHAFKFSAVDYLLKPVNPEELVKALEKANLQQHVHHQAAMQNLMQNQKENKKSQKLVLGNTENIYLVDLNEVIRCQAEGNYTRFYLTEDRVILVSKTLKEYVEILDTANFFRAHKSHIFNLSFFSRFERKDGGTVHLKDGSTLPVAVRRKDELLEVLKLQ